MASYQDVFTEFSLVSLMKIIQVFNQYLEPGGEENSVNRIFRHLEIGGHDVKRFLRRSEEWTGHKAPSRWKQALMIGYNEEVLGDLRTMHNQFSPDIWILHNVVPVVSLGVYKLARELNVPIVQWLHNYRPISVSGGLPDSKCPVYLKECLTGAWRDSRAQTIVLALHYLKAHLTGSFEAVKVWITVSDSMRQTFKKAGWPPERLATLHHSWDIEEVLPANGGENYYLFLGRIIEEKGIRFLVNLFSQAEMQDQILYVAGAGVLEKELKAISSANIKWLGFVTGKEKRKLIRNSSALLFPSLWKEPLSTVAYEAYEQNRCMITSSQGGMSEIVIDGKTGLVLPPGNRETWSRTIREETKPHLDQMGRTAREWLDENISPEKWDQKFRSILDEKLSD